MSVRIWKHIDLAVDKWVGWNRTTKRYSNKTSVPVALWDKQKEPIFLLQRCRDISIYDYYFKFITFWNKFSYSSIEWSATDRHVICAGNRPDFMQIILLHFHHVKPLYVYVQLREWDFIFLSMRYKWLTEKIQ